MKQLPVPAATLGPILGLILGLLLTLTSTACTPGETPGEDEAPPAAAAAVVDSVFPMDVMLDRFRADLSEAWRLERGADSRDALVEGLVHALERADTLAFEKLAVGLSEWAWLYYPTSAQALPPYELPPGMAWMQLQENNRKGVLRALERFGGQPLDYVGHTCNPDPAMEGENRVWVGCLVTLAREGEEATPVRLFSSILERNGRFAVLSYANDF